MIYSHEVQHMCCVKKGANHPSAPIPEEGKWVRAKEIKDISGLTHGVGWCAPQQGACKLTLNIKDGIIQEAMVETLGCSGMTHSAAMASEILPGKTLLEALNTDLVRISKRPKPAMVTFSSARRQSAIWSNIASIVVSTCASVKPVLRATVSIIWERVMYLYPPGVSKSNVFWQILRC